MTNPDRQFTRKKMKQKEVKTAFFIHVIGATMNVVFYSNKMEK